MRAEHDAMILVRADLCDRLERLQSMSKRLSAADFANALAAIRTVAAAYGLVPVVRLSEALDRAPAEPGRCPRALYLDRLRDAIGCERLDDQASQAMLASISVRLGA